MSLDDVLAGIEGLLAPELAELDARISELAQEREARAMYAAKVRRVGELLRGVRALACLTPTEQADLLARRYSVSLIRKGMMVKSHRARSLKRGRGDVEYLTPLGYAANAVQRDERPAPEGLAALADGLLAGMKGPPLDAALAEMGAKGLFPVGPEDAPRVLRILASHLPSEGDRRDAHTLLALWERGR